MARALPGDLARAGSRERQQLRRQQFQLIRDGHVDQFSCLVPDLVCGVDRNAERSGPGPQRMSDGAELVQRADRRLPPVSTADAAPRFVVEVDAGVLTPLLPLLEYLPHHSRYTAALPP